MDTESEKARVRLLAESGRGLVLAESVDAALREVQSSLLSGDLPGALKAWGRSRRIAERLGELFKPT